MRSISIGIFLTLLLGGCALAPAAPQHACLHRHADEEQDIGYCAALRSGDTLYLSGTVGTEPMPAAVQAVYARLGQTLKEQGLSFADVVKENVYTTRLDEFIQAAPLRKAFYGGSYPAATWVGVERLYEKEDVLEVELIAKYPPRR